MATSIPRQDSPVLSAGVVVVRYHAATPYFLLLRVYNYWDFPKGLLEKGEEPLAAAVREVEEETGLKELSFLWGMEFRQTAPYRSSGGTKVARFYLAESSAGEVRLPVSPELGRPEHHEFRWLPYTEARELLSDRLKPILDWGHGLVVSS